MQYTASKISEGSPLETISTYFYYSSSPVSMKTPNRIPSNSNSPSTFSGNGGSNSRKRIRMSRCGQCEGCNATNCEKCYKCLDMIKYGGPGTLKQACERRQCVNPQMPGSSPLMSSPLFSPKGMFRLSILRDEY